MLGPPLCYVTFELKMIFIIKLFNLKSTLTNSGKPNITVVILFSVGSHLIKLRPLCSLKG